VSKKATVWVLLGFLLTFVSLLVLNHQAATVSGPEALQNKVLADPADPTKGWTFSAANALTGRFGTFLHGNSVNRTYITLDISGAIPMLVSSQTPPSDIVCAVGADKVASLTCNNGTGKNATSDTPFATSYTIPAYFMTQGRMIRLRYGIELWAPAGKSGKRHSHSSYEELTVTLKAGATVLSSNTVPLSGNGASGLGSVLEYDLVGTEVARKSAPVIVEPVIATIPGAANAGQGNHKAQPIQLDTSSPQTITLNLAYSNGAAAGNAIKLLYLQVKAE